MTFCCVCAGVCNHIGPHSYCNAHMPNQIQHTVPYPWNYPQYNVIIDTQKIDKLIEEVQQLKKEIKELMERQK